MEAGLYIVGTPIGNLEDITMRALAVLREANAVLAEDTRRTRCLLDRYDIRVPLVSCHKFNEASRIAAVLDRLGRGEAVAMVTDSGMPGISDPGSRVVDACHTRGIRVVVVPGPSAATAAVALSGFGGRGYVFEGFLPRKPGARRRKLAEMAAQALPIVFFENPHRLPQVLREMSELMAARRICLAREMTKKFEECVVGTPAEVLAAFEGRPVRGEATVVVAGRD